MNDFSDLLERLSALQRNLMRKFAAEHSLQVVHVEIISYLSRCNRYSNTTQGLTEYLGQTKGSLSQSLAVLEENGFVKRTQDDSDRRIFHLDLLAKARRLMVEYDSNYAIKANGTLDAKKLLSILQETQLKYGKRSFGICATCRFNLNPEKNRFVCGLTNEALSKDDTALLCREFESRSS